MRSSAASKSRATAGSACSLIVTPGGRVRDEDERGGGAVRVAERSLDVAGDVDELRLPLGLHGDLTHATILGRWPAAPPTTQELDRIRDRADRFIAELDEEYYQHFAGLKDTLDLAPIYERYADLTTLDTANAIGAAVNGDKHLTRALALRLRELPRRPDARAQREGRDARGDPRGRDRRHRRCPSGCCARRSATSPTATSAARSTGSARR